MLIQNREWKGFKHLLYWDLSIHNACYQQQPWRPVDRWWTDSTYESRHNVNNQMVDHEKQLSIKSFTFRVYLYVFSVTDIYVQDSPLPPPSPLHHTVPTRDGRTESLEENRRHFILPAAVTMVSSESTYRSNNSVYPQLSHVHPCTYWISLANVATPYILKLPSAISPLCEIKNT